MKSLKESLFDDDLHTHIFGDVNYYTKELAIEISKILKTTPSVFGKNPVKKSDWDDNDKWNVCYDQIDLNEYPNLGGSVSITKFIKMYYNNKEYYIKFDFDIQLDHFKDSLNLYVSELNLSSSWWEDGRLSRSIARVSIPDDNRFYNNDDKEERLDIIKKYTNLRNNNCFDNFKEIKKVIKGIVEKLKSFFDQDYAHSKNKYDGLYSLLFEIIKLINVKSSMSVRSHQLCCAGKMNNILKDICK